MDWTTAPWMGFDTETTGVDPHEDRLVTAALVWRDGGVSPKAPDQYKTWLADPGVPIPESSTRIHGITTERAQAEGRPIAEVLEEVAATLIHHWKQGFPVVAFNASFDITLLNHELARHGLQSLEDRLGGEPAPVLDPLVLDRKLDRFRKGKKTLVLMTEAYGLEVSDNAHTAQYDVAMTLDVLAAIAGKFPKIARLDEAQVHAFQKDAHREWAVDREEFMRSKGRDVTIEKTWPQV